MYSLKSNKVIDFESPGFHVALGPLLIGTSGSFMCMCTYTAGFPETLVGVCCINLLLLENIEERRKIKCLILTRGYYHIFQQWDMSWPCPSGAKVIIISNISAESQSHM